MTQIGLRVETSHKAPPDRPARRRRWLRPHPNCGNFYRSDYKVGAGVISAHVGLRPF